MPSADPRSGAPVPAGAQVRVEGQVGAFPVALNGDAYLTGLSPRNRAVATWLDHECAFEFDYPETGDPQLTAVLLSAGVLLS